MSQQANPPTAQFLAATRRAQAAHIIGGLRSTLLFNIIISLSAALIVFLGYGFSPAIAAWLAATFLSAAYRAITARRLARFNYTETDPDYALRFMSIGALLSGLIWASLPFCVPDFSAAGKDAAVSLIMVGISAGSMIRGIGYSQLSMAFAVPILLSIVLWLTYIGDTSSTIMAFDVLCLTAIMVHSNISGERVFVSNEIAKLEATSLAGSLETANDDIQQKNRRLEVLANRDTITGLANRMHFNGRLLGDIAREKTIGGEVALLLIDLDRFKQINDTLGHSAGDALLKAVGGINPARLEIEITEEAILDADGAGEQLKRLENAGYKLAVDDFGVGHSSLAYLISLKVDRLKIDRSFAKGVAESRANQDLIAALVGLGHALKLDIVVEGVETAEDAEVLEALGCRIAQGYHFARPMPVESLFAWIARRGESEDLRLAVA